MKTTEMVLALILGFFVGNNLAWCLGIDPWGIPAIMLSLLMGILLWAVSN